MTYRSAQGYWAQDPDHVLAYAAHGVDATMKKRGVNKIIRESKSKIMRAMRAPVEAFDWGTWYTKNFYDRAAVIQKARPTKPKNLAAMDQVIEFYVKHATTRLNDATQELHRRVSSHVLASMNVAHTPEDLQTGIDATFENYTSKIVDTSANKLRSVLEDTLASGDGTPGDFSKNLRSEWNDFTKSQADTIAWTEYNTVASQATLSSYKENGISHKAWITVSDGEVCDDCEGNESQGPIPIDDTFDSGDDAPPAHPNCRCNVTSVVNPEFALPSDYSDTGEGQEPLPTKKSGGAWSRLMSWVKRSLGGSDGVLTTGDLAIGGGLLAPGQPKKLKKVPIEGTKLKEKERP